MPWVFQPSFVDLGQKLGVLQKAFCPPPGPEAEKRPAEQPNGHPPENRSYPELPQNMGDMILLTVESDLKNGGLNLK